MALRGKHHPSHCGRNSMTKPSASITRPESSLSQRPPCSVSLLLASALTARVTTNHPASFRILEKLGLTQVWEGRRVGTENNPEEPNVRIYADRELDEDTLQFLINRP